MTTQKHLELIFPANVAPDVDLEITETATETAPGRARLKAAKAVRVSDFGERIFSGNGGTLIGVIGYGPPEPPYLLTYWLEDSPSPSSGAQAGVGERGRR